jgi:hypothetical protein
MDDKQEVFLKNYEGWSLITSFGVSGRERISVATLIIKYLRKQGERNDIIIKHRFQSVRKITPLFRTKC